MLGKFNADLAPGDPAEDYIVVDFFTTYIVIALLDLVSVGRVRVGCPHTVSRVS